MIVISIVSIEAVPTASSKQWVPCFDSAVKEAAAHRRGDPAPSDWVPRFESAVEEAELRDRGLKRPGSNIVLRRLKSYGKKSFSIG